MITTVLRKGSKGNLVFKLQELLKIPADGIFGRATERAVIEFQVQHKLVADGIVGQATWKKLLTLQTDKKLQIPVTIYPLSKEEYVNEAVEKKQVYLHHTVSTGSAINVINTWERDTNSKGKPTRVATSFVISRKYNLLGQKCYDGQIFQCFDPNMWAWHLGSGNSNLEPISIGIEICSWGGLKPDRYGNLVHYFGKTVPENEIYQHHTEFRGYRWFHKYTDAQLESTRKLLLDLKRGWDLEFQSAYDESFFDYKPEIRDGRMGLFTHTNVRLDKSDCFPQPELIQMLNSL